MRSVPFTFVLLLVLAAALLADARGADAQTLKIGTAGLMGNYHPLGRAVCRIVNLTRSEHRLRCKAEPTEGSIENIEGVGSGRFDIGIAQSDTQYFAVHGTGAFAGRPQQKLRALFTVYTEVFTLVARPGANIGSFADLRGLRVAIGTRESGTRATMDQLLRAYGLAPADLALAAELRYVDLVPALCDDRIDAFVLVDGHPNSIVADAAASCRAKIVAIAGPQVDALMATHPYYVPADVPGGLYPGIDSARRSFGVPATLVVSSDMDDAQAYAFVKAIFENFDDFRKLNPALAGATRRGALAGATAPVHPGALRYFTEAGLQ